MLCRPVLGGPVLNRAVLRRPVFHRTVLHGAMLRRPVLHGAVLRGRGPGLFLHNDCLGNRTGRRGGSDRLRLRLRSNRGGLLDHVDDLLFYHDHLLLLNGGRGGVFNRGMRLLLGLLVLDESRLGLFLALEFLRHDAH